MEASVLSVSSTASRSNFAVPNRKGNGNFEKNNGPLSLATNLELDYLVGVKNLRNTLTELDEARGNIEHQFYDSLATISDSELPDGDQSSLATRSLTGIERVLREAVGADDSESVVIDSESKLVELIGRLRTSAEPRAFELSKHVTCFWKDLSGTVEQFRGLADRFQRSVLFRMKANCSSFSDLFCFGLQNRTVSTFETEVIGFLQRIDALTAHCKLLATSYGASFPSISTGREGTRVDRLVSGCDLERFPVIRLVPEMSENLGGMFHQAFDWLARDERFLTELARDIRLGRSRQVEIQNLLVTGRERQRNIAKELRGAYLSVRNSSGRIHSLERDLRELNVRADDYRTSVITKQQLMGKKAGMNDFFEAATPNKARAKKEVMINKVRLRKQMTDLEQLISTLETELAKIERIIASKSSEVDSLQKKHEELMHEYEASKQQFADYSAEIIGLEQQLAALQEDLCKAEALRDFKTSPDVVDDFYDRPANIKLSQSLQRRLNQRKRSAVPNLTED